MKQVLWSTRLVFLAAVLVLTGVACSRQPSIPPEVESRIVELGKEFISDLTGYIIPAKLDLESLEDREGIAVSTDQAAYNVDEVYAFYNRRGEGEDCTLTMVFSNSVYVVTRLVFEDGQGYCFRYQLDEKDTGPIEITSQTMDSLDLEVDMAVGKVELCVYRDGKELGRYKFYDTYREEAQ